MRWAEKTPVEWHRLDLAANIDLETTGVARAWETEYFRKDGSRVPVLVGVAMLEAVVLGTTFLVLARPTLTVRCRRSELRVGFLITVTTFSAARQVTLDELRIERMVR